MTVDQPDRRLHCLNGAVSLVAGAPRTFCQGIAGTQEPWLDPAGGTGMGVFQLHESRP